MKYWLLKSEPSSYSIDDLFAAPNRTTFWNGVRNYQARNFMRDEMQKGDKAFFYHSGSDSPGIVGIAEIVRAAYPDSSAFDKSSQYYDPKSDPANPTWVMVDVKGVERFDETLTLAALRKVKGLDGMELLRRGSRLSVQPVEEKHWTTIDKLRRR